MNEACDRTRDRLSAALDGVLAPPESAALEAHLARCSDCRAIRQDLLEVDRLLAATGPMPYPPVSTDHLLDRLHRDLEAQRQTSILRKLVTWWTDHAGPRWSLAAVGAMALALILLQPWSGTVEAPVVALARGPSGGPSPMARAGGAATSDPVGVRESSGHRIKNEIDEIEHEIAGLDRRVRDFRERASRIAHQQDRQFADRRVPEWR